MTSPVTAATTARRPPVIAMTDIVELRTAYEAILLRRFRGEISDAQCVAEATALDNSPAAVGLSSRQRGDIAAEAVADVALILAEVRRSGKWQ